MAKKPILQLLNGVTRFGRLTLIGDGAPLISGSRSLRRARFKCDCGAVIDRRPYKLKNSNLISCGCWRAERLLEIRTKHGMTGTPEFAAWSSIKNRCLNPKVKNWKDYGGRGISICERWRNSFEAFFEDMGPRPSNAFSIDRVDNDRGYEPGNCEWATRTQQSINRRCVKHFDFQGERLTLREIAERTGLERRTIVARLKRGWTIERAAEEPSTLRGRKGVPKPKRKPANQQR